MTKYETLILCKPELGDEAYQALVTRLDGFITATQGKMAEVNLWGHRRLGYPVAYRGANYVTGFYVLLTYLGSGATVLEVERNIKMLDDVMRYQTVMLEKKVDPATVTEVKQTRLADDLREPEVPFGDADDDERPRYGRRSRYEPRSDAPAPAADRGPERAAPQPTPEAAPPAPALEPKTEEEPA